MADVTKTVGIVFQGEDKTSDTAARVAAGMDKLDDATKRSAASAGLWQDAAGKWRNEAGQFASNAEKAAAGLDAMGRSAGTARSALAEIASAASIGLLVKPFIDANVELERFSRGMLAVKGNGELASAELDYFKSAADRLGLSVRETSGGYVSFMASVKGTTLEGEPARKIFENISGAMSNLGKSSADTTAVLNALSQSVSKGQIYSEELRGQIGERLPGAFQLFAKSMGVSTQELDKLLEAGAVGIDKILAFSEATKDAFGGSDRVEGYTASLNRLKNATDEAFVAIGNSGLFDALTSSLKTGAKFAEALAGGFTYLADSYRAFQYLLNGGNFETYVLALELADEKAGKMAKKLQGETSDALRENAKFLRQAEESANLLGAAYDKIETAKFVRQANALTDQLKAEAEALKTLNVNKEAVNRSTQDYANLLVTIGKSQGQTDAVFLAAVASASKQIRAGTNDVTIFKDALSDSEVVGARSGDTIAKAFKIVDEAASKAAKKGNEYTKELEKQAEQAKKAEEAQERLRLEMEKLASNERIKLIEARVQLNVADVQEQTKRIQAAFESLDNTVNSTADVINKAFGLLSGDQTFMDSVVRGRLFNQMDLENKNRERALKMQEELTKAQIDVLRQQARQLEKGEALIKVDGAGLEPEIEAFMWKILQKVQVRTNRDGLKLLAGVA